MKTLLVRVYLARKLIKLLIFGPELLYQIFLVFLQFLSDLVSMPQLFFNAM